MSAVLQRWLGRNRRLLENTGSLLGSTAVTSLLGFAYWWLAARLFPQAAVGEASAAISAMTLLGTFSLIGLDSLLMGALPQQRGRAGSLIVTALLAGTVSAVALGLLFTLVAPLLSANLQLLGADAGSRALFVLGVAVMTLTMVVDPILIGVQRGGLQLLRNALFAVAKLVLLGLAGLALTAGGALAISLSWTVGALLSLAVLFRSLPRGVGLGDLWPRWGWVSLLSGSALQHYGFNLATQAAGLLMPMVVVVVLSTEQNANFFIAWTLARTLFLVSFSLTTALYAVSAAEPHALAQRLRSTLAMALLMALGANLVFAVGAEWVLHLFGRAYAEQASWCLRLLGLAAFPVLIRHHYMAVCRVQGRLVHAMPFILLGGLLELVTAYLGGLLGGLNGLSIGWLLALAAQGLLMLRPVWQAALGDHARPAAILAQILGTLRAALRRPRPSGQG